MISAFLKIRIKQSFRSLSEIGLFRTIIVLFLLSLLFLWIFSLLAQQSSLHWVAFFYFAVILIIHVKRGDILFLKTHFINFKFVLFVEYFFLTIPLLLGLIYYGNYFVALAVFVAISLLLSFEIKIKKRSWNSLLQRLIPDSCFEWKAGVRRFFIPLILIWTSAAIFSFFVGTVPILVYILGFIILSFNEKCEPIQMILLYEKSPKSFLVMKMKTQLLLFSIITLPLIFLFLIFHIQLWYIPVAEFVVLLSLVVYVTLLKYSFYAPNQQPAATQVFVIIGSLGLVMPFFIPLIWVLSIRFYLKATKNLKHYLNDYNL